MTYVYAKSPPRAIEYPLSELFEMANYTIKGATLNYDSTSPHELFDIPANTLVLGIGWRCTEGFVDAGVQLNPKVELGDTAETLMFGKLTAAQLSDSDRTGFIQVYYESTAAMKIDAQYTSDGASTAGNVEFWLTFRPNCATQRWTNRI